MKKKSVVCKPIGTPMESTAFAEVAGLIIAARQRALRAVNTVLIDLYWQVGEYISRKVAAEAWGNLSGEMKLV